MPSFAFHIKPATIVILACIVWVVLGTYLVGLPFSEKLAVKTAELSQKEQEADRLAQRKEALSSLETKLAKYDTELQRLFVAYPTDEQVVEAMIQLQGMADRAGVAVADMKPAKSQVNGLPVNLTTTGSYENTIKLLKEFELNLRPVKVEAFSFAKATDQSDNVTGTFQLSLGFAQTAPAPVTSPAVQEGL